MTGRPVLLAILLMPLCLAGGQVRAGEDLMFRTAVTPEEPWVGQQVVLSIDVLAKDGWAQLKKFGDVEVDGAYLMRLETQGTRLNEVIAGESYTGQRYKFMVFAQRDGRVTIPPMPVDVEIKNWAAGGDARAERRTLPAIAFQARTPPGAEGIRGLISTSDLQAEQRWEPEPGEPRVGEAIERRITLRAADVSAMAFSPLRYARIENVGVYPGQPAVEDSFNRGKLTGTRVETVTYVFERPGDIEIPGIVVSWWDVRRSELRREELPGLSLRVGAGAQAPAAPGEVAEPARKPDSRLLWSVLFAFLIAAVLAFRYGGNLLDRLAAWRQARSETEARYFARVKRCARSGDQQALLRETMRWLDRINDGSQPARLDVFLQRYGDTETQHAAQALMSNADGQGRRAGLKAFASGLSIARDRWRKASRVQRQVRGVLPALNGGLDSI